MLTGIDAKVQKLILVGKRFILQGTVFTFKEQSQEWVGS